MFLSRRLKGRSEHLEKHIEDIESDFNSFKMTLEELLIKNKKLIDTYKNIGKVIYNSSDNEKYIALMNEREKLEIKYENLIWVLKHLKKLNENILFDIGIKRPLFKLVYDKADIPICFVTKIYKEIDTNIRTVRVIGVTDYKKNDDWFYGYIDCNMYITKVDNGFKLIISTLEAKNNYRLGRGTAIIKYIEEVLVPFINGEIKRCYNQFDMSDGEDKLIEIEGHIAPIGETTYRENVKFYKQLGYKVINRNFHKNLV